MTSEKGPDRFYINKEDRKDYESLLDRDSPFKDKENKDLFIMAMAVGYAEGSKTRLKKREGFFRESYLDVRERAIISALAVAEKGNLNVLLDKSEVFSIAEGYAAGGIRLLKDKVFSGEYGSYARKLETELVETFNKITAKKLRQTDEAG